MSGLKVSALVETCATHSLVRSRTVISLHSGIEFIQEKFKAMNYEIRHVMGKINATPITCI